MRKTSQASYPGRPQIRTEGDWDDDDRGYTDEVAANVVTDPTVTAPLLLGLRELADEDPRAWHNPGQIVNDHRAQTAQPALEALVAAGVAERAVYHGDYRNIVYRLTERRVDADAHTRDGGEREGNEKGRDADHPAPGPRWSNRLPGGPLTVRPTARPASSL